MLEINATVYYTEIWNDMVWFPLIKLVNWLNSVHPVEEDSESSAMLQFCEAVLCTAVFWTKWL